MGVFASPLSVVFIERHTCVTLRGCARGPRGLPGQRGERNVP